jgi:Fe-S cluster assembly protein SufD
VKPHAQKTDGKMASNALLLGEHAAMHGKPELEIFADDVVCAHGMTVGALDDDLLFYVMSRGVPRKEAEGLMIQAFAGEALEAVAHEGLRGALIGLTAEWIAART